MTRMLRWNWVISAGIALFASSLACADNQVTVRAARTWNGRASIAQGPFSLGPSPGKDLTHQHCKITDSNPCNVQITVKITSSSAGLICDFDGPDVVVLKDDQIKVTWVLTDKSPAPAGARFRNKPGADDGIQIYQNPNKTYFSGRTHSNSQFVLVRSETPSNGTHVIHYDINVDTDFGPCNVPDPIIVNRD